MKLEDIQKLCDEATPGPWTYDEVINPSITYERKDAVIHEISDPGNYIYLEDAKFIAASRELLPKLLAVVKAAKNLQDDYLWRHEGGQDDRQYLVENLKSSLEDLENS